MTREDRKDQIKRIKSKKRPPNMCRTRTFLRTRKRIIRIKENKRTRIINKSISNHRKQNIQKEHPIKRAIIKYHHHSILKHNKIQW